MNLRFVLRMAWRESRGSRGRLVLFALCVACGVAVMVCTDSVTANLRDRLTQESRNLLAGDVEMDSRRPFTDKFRADVQRVEPAGTVMAESAELLSMVATFDQSVTRLTEVKAVSGTYPLYGDLGAVPAAAAGDFRAGKGVLVASGLLTQMDVTPGTRLRIGDLVLPISGTLGMEPDRMGEAFRLGQRVLMRLDDLKQTGLVGPMSRVSYRMLLRLPDGTDASLIRDRLKSETAERWVEFRLAGEGAQGVERFLSRAEVFLNLVGLAALLLAGIGVAIAIRTFVAQRMDSLATLKCLGVTSFQLVGIYLVQVCVIAFAGSALGALAGTLLQRTMPGLLSGVVPFAVAPAAVPLVILRGILIGTILSTSFAVIPVLALRRVPPLSIFTRAVSGGSAASYRDPLSAVAVVVLALACALLAVYRARSVPMAGWFLGGFAVVLVGLYITTWILLRVLRALKRLGPFWLRHGMANVYRPGNQTGSVMVAISLGVFLVQTVYLVETVLRTEFTSGLTNTSPNFFLVDVQEDQLDRVRSLFQKANVPLAEVAPLVRSHLSKIDGRSIHDLYPDLEKAPWWVGREYVLTYRNELSPSENLVRGTYWGPRGAGGAEVSVESSTADRIGIDVGSNLAVDIQGEEVIAKVTSIRTVRWSSMRPNFFMVMTPHLLEHFPHTYFVVAHVPTPEQRLDLQRQLVKSAPNLTVIDLSAGLEVLRALVDRLAIVIGLAALLCIAGGILVLSASVAMTRRHRTYECAILKSLGMTRRELVSMLAVEYALLGLAGGAVGAVAAHLAAGMLARRMFEVILMTRPVATLVATLCAAGLTVLTGALASRGILAGAPLAILRDE